MVFRLSEIQRTLGFERNRALSIFSLYLHAASHTSGDVPSKSLEDTAVSKRETVQKKANNQLSLIWIRILACFSRTHRSSTTQFTEVSDTRVDTYSERARASKKSTQIKRRPLESQRSLLQITENCSPNSGDCCHRAEFRWPINERVLSSFMEIL